mmetsp:Transcript_4379/g.7455  ORF Transcript_4379/g.7455 Transcript_4379/m.7455 type:complete len:291 (+) Transcript_4379:867-1739(+)
MFHGDDPGDGPCGVLGAPKPQRAPEHECAHRHCHGGALARVGDCGDQRAQREGQLYPGDAVGGDSGGRGGDRDVLAGRRVRARGARRVLLRRPALLHRALPAHLPLAHPRRHPRGGLSRGAAVAVPGLEREGQGRGHPHHRRPLVLLRAGGAALGAAADVRDDRRVDGQPGYGPVPQLAARGHAHLPVTGAAQPRPHAQSRLRGRQHASTDQRGVLHSERVGAEPRLSEADCWGHWLFVLLALDGTVHRGDSRKLPGRVAETPHQPRLDGVRHPSGGERRLGQGGGRELP